jgi:hypothetical protein
LHTRSRCAWSNAADIDRIVRILAGLALIAWALLGISTCPMQKQ